MPPDRRSRDGPHRAARDCPRSGPRRLVLPLGSLVEVAAVHARDAGKEHPRDRAGQLVERGHGVVVVLPREGDLVLGVGQLLLQVEEVLVGLQVGVVLRDRVDVGERTGELGVGGGLGGDVVSLGRLLHARAGVGDLLEDALLVRGVPLDRLDQVGDQVRASRQLYVDAAQRLLGSDVGAAQLVEADDAEGDEGHQDDDDDDPDHADLLRCAPDRPARLDCGAEAHQEPPPPPPPPPPPEKPPPPPPPDEELWVAW